MPLLSPSHAELENLAAGLVAGADWARAHVVTECNGTSVFTGKVRLGPHRCFLKVAQVELGEDDYELSSYRMALDQIEAEARLPKGYPGARHLDHGMVPGSREHRDIAWLAHRWIPGDNVPNMLERDPNNAPEYIGRVAKLAVAAATPIAEFGPGAPVKDAGAALRRYYQGGWQTFADDPRLIGELRPGFGELIRANLEQYVAAEHAAREHYTSTYLCHSDPYLKNVMLSRNGSRGDVFIDNTFYAGPIWQDLTQFMVGIRRMWYLDLDTEVIDREFDAGLVELGCDPAAVNQCLVATAGRELADTLLYPINPGTWEDSPSDVPTPSPSPVPPLDLDSPELLGWATDRLKFSQVANKTHPMAGQRWWQVPQSGILRRNPRRRS